MFSHNFSLSQIPLVRILLPFVLGIIAVQLENSLSFIDLKFLIAFAVLFFVLLFTSEKFQKFRFTSHLALVVLFIVGTIHAKQFSVQRSKAVDKVLKTKWIGEVKMIVKKEGNRKNILVEIDKIKPDSSWISLKFYVNFYSDYSGTELRVGDLISGESRFRRYEPSLNPKQFDLRSYMANKGIFLYAFEDEFALRGRTFSFEAMFANFRNKIIKAYEQMGFKGDEKAVLVALSLGDKTQLDVELKRSYAVSGAIHVLAVSGLHVGIIFLLVTQLMRYLPNQKLFRWLRAFVVLVSIWSFAFLTGLSPSVKRASFMFSFIVLAKAMNRNSTVLNSVAGSALILLLINPALLFEVGFQLSYAAVVGIILIYPVMYSWIKSRYAIVNKIWSLMSISIAATLSTLPFTLFYFHQFPNWFLLTNLLVIPLTFAIVLGSIVVCLSWFLLGSNFFLTEILNSILKLLNYSISYVNRLPFSVTEGIWLSSYSIALLGLSIVSLIIYLIVINKRYLFAFLVSILILITVEFVVKLNQLSNSFIGFYALNETPIVAVNGLTAEIFISDKTSDYDKQIIENHLNSLGVERIKWVRPNEIMVSRFYKKMESKDGRLLSVFSTQIHTPFSKQYVNAIDSIGPNEIILLEDVKGILEAVDVFPEAKLILEFDFPSWYSSKDAYLNGLEGYSIKDQGYFQLDL